MGDQALHNGSDPVDNELVNHVIRCIYSESSKHGHKPNGDNGDDGKMQNGVVQKLDESNEKKQVYSKFVHNFLWAVARDLVHKCNERKKEMALAENSMSKKIVENCSHFKLYVKLLEQLSNEDRSIIINSMTNH